METKIAEKLPRQKKQDHILAVATKLFLKVGYGAVSMDFLAKTAKVSKPTLYTKYKSKEELFMAVVKNYREKQNVIYPIIRRDKFTNQKELLQDYFTQCAQYFLTDAVVDLVRLVIAELPHFPVLYDLYFQDNRVQLTKILENYFKEENDNNKLNIPNPKVAAMQIIGMIREQTMWIKLFKIKENLKIDKCDDIVSNVLEFSMQYLK